MIVKCSRIYLATVSSWHLSVIEIGEVIYNIITNHSNTARSLIHRHTTPCARWIQQNICNTLPLIAPQLEQPIQSMIETHISSSGTHTSILFNWTNTILSYHRIPNATHLPISIPAMTHCHDLIIYLSFLCFSPFYPCVSLLFLIS